MGKECEHDNHIGMDLCKISQDLLRDLLSQQHIACAARGQVCIPCLPNQESGSGSWFPSNGHQQLPRVSRFDGSTNIVKHHARQQLLENISVSAKRGHRGTASKMN